MAAPSGVVAISMLSGSGRCGCALRRTARIMTHLIDSMHVELVRNVMDLLSCAADGRARHERRVDAVTARRASEARLGEHVGLRERERESQGS